MAAAEPKGHGQHAGMWVYPDAKAMSQDVSEKSRVMAKPFTMALIVSGILFILAIVGFIAGRLMTDSTKSAPGVTTQPSSP